MSDADQLANRLTEVLLSGKWVANTNLKEQLQDISLRQAQTQIGDLNTIAVLTYHLNYYLEGVLEVIEGGELTIRDQFSFDLPELPTEKSWIDLKERLYTNSESFANHVRKMSDEKLQSTFVDEKYGNYHRKINVIIEHTYYHLGQVVLIKKLLNSST